MLYSRSRGFVYHTRRILVMVLAIAMLGMYIVPAQMVFAGESDGLEDEIVVTVTDDDPAPPEDPDDPAPPDDDPDPDDPDLGDGLGLGDDSDLDDDLDLDPDLDPDEELDDISPFFNEFAMFSLFEEEGEFGLLAEPGFQDVPSVGGHDWANVLGSSQFGFSMPDNAQSLEFNDVSNNGHTFLDYVYLMVDGDGNVSLIFLAFSDNKDFNDSGMSYAGISGYRVGGWDVDGKHMYRAYRVDIPASVVPSLGSNNVSILTSNKPHSIDNENLVITNLRYSTEHYTFEGTYSPGGATLYRTIPGAGFAGITVNATPINIFGYELVTVVDTVASGTIPSSGTLVLKLYYQKTNNYLWSITGVTETTEENGSVQYLSDFAGNLYTITFPNNTDYTFSGNLTLTDPSGITEGTYNQNLAPEAGYKIWYDGDNKSEGVVGPEDVTAILGSPQINNGALIITAKPTFEVIVNNSNAAITGAGTYESGETVTIDAGSPAAGWEFDCWTVNSANATLDDADAAETFFTMPAADVEVTANWKKIDYTVTYDANGGSGAPVDSDNPYNVGNTVTVLDGIPVFPGYTFEGWLYNGSIYEDGDTFTMPAANVTLVAQWDAISYYVTYDANGGSGAPVDNIAYNVGNTVTVLDGIPVFPGYTFEGWLYDENIYEDGDSITMPASDITLTAQWTAIDYNVTYNANGGSGAPVDSNAYNVGNTVTVLDGIPVRTGHTFEGWLYNGSIYEDGDTITMPAANVELVAQWSKNIYTVTYSMYPLNDTRGTWAEDDSVVYTKTYEYGDQLGTGIPTPVADAAYSDDPGRWIAGNGTPLATTVVENNMFFYYTYDNKNVYTVTYEIVNGTWGGTVVTVTEDVIHGETLQQIPENMTPNAGYTQNPGAWDEPVPTVETVVTGDMTFVYRYTTLNVYTVTYNIVNGTWPGGVTTVTETFTHGDVLGETIPTGTANAGYTDDPGAWDEPAPNSETAVYSDMTFTFRYTNGNSYLIIYNANGGVGTMANTAATYNENVRLRNNSFTRSGYDFTGWNTQRNGSGTNYANLYTFRPWTRTSNLTLYAQWTPVGGGGPDDIPTPPPIIVIIPEPPGEDPTPPPIVTTQTTIADEEPPLAAPPTTIMPEPAPLASFAAWALLNLILTIVTGVIMALLLVTYFYKRKSDLEDDPDYDQKVKKHLPLRIVTIATTIVAIILFILTEDMTLPMVFTDKWTVWHIIIGVATILLAIFSRKQYEDEELEAERA